MGMYTQLVLNVELKPEVPKEVIEALRYMILPCSDVAIEDVVLDDPLFRTRRWAGMLRSSSYYFSPATSHSLLRRDQDTWYLSVLCDLKNYDNEIALFLDWIKPHVADTGFVGYSRYEEDDHPELIYF